MSADPSPLAPTAAAVAPKRVIAADNPGSAHAFVVDDESSIRQFVSLILQGSGIATTEFVDGGAFRKAASARTPDLIILNVSLDVQDAIQSVDTLSNAGYAGAVQLMSSRGMAVLDTVKQAGEQRNLRMLPVLKKPFETSAIQKIVADLRLGFSPPPEVKIELSAALSKNWVEFWYQPKVNLQKKELAGAEAFARVRHPVHGVLSPSNFMAGADETSLRLLSQQALVGALRFGLNLSKLGVNLPIAVNVGLNALVKLPIGDIVRALRPQLHNWPGLIIDVTEAEIVTEIPLAQEMSKKLSAHNVRLAIDDFGKSYTALMRLKELPFAEMKLDRSFVTGCGTDKVHAPICKAVIDLAHGFGGLAVATGLEKASDAAALVAMGCDLGQGFLLGQPMPEERFVALLRQRIMVRPQPPGAAAAPTVPAH